MANAKAKRNTKTLTLRVEPRNHEAAEIAAKRDHRSVTNFIEVLVLQRCAELGIEVTDTEPEDKNADTQN